MPSLATDFRGRVTFITGPEKHCGKTTFMNRAAWLVRAAGQPDVSAITGAGHGAYGQIPGAMDSGSAFQHPGVDAGEGAMQERTGRERRGTGTEAGSDLAQERTGSGLALMTVGYDGEARDLLSGVRKPAVPVCPGDIILTTGLFARACGPEILDVLPGSSALGRLCLARATRHATVALVGPEGNSLVAFAIRRVLEEGWADTVLVDGAINRITQVASLPGASFVYVMRVEPAGLPQAVSRVRRMSTLVHLPVLDNIEDSMDAAASAKGGAGFTTSAARPAGGAPEVSAGSAGLAATDLQAGSDAGSAGFTTSAAGPAGGAPEVPAGSAGFAAGAAGLAGSALEVPAGDAGFAAAADLQADSGVGSAGFTTSAVGPAAGAPEVPLGGAGAGKVAMLDGPLTTDTAGALAASVRAVAVDDLTKVFLSEQELAAFRRGRRLFVRRKLHFAGFVIACRGMSFGAFVDALGGTVPASLVAPNPYESGVVAESVA